MTPTFCLFRPPSLPPTCPAQAPGAILCPAGWRRSEAQSWLQAAPRQAASPHRVVPRARSSGFMCTRRQGGGCRLWGESFPCPMSPSPKATQVTRGLRQPPLSGFHCPMSSADPLEEDRGLSLRKVSGCGIKVSVPLSWEVKVGSVSAPLRPVCTAACHLGCSLQPDASCRGPGLPSAFQHNF